MAFTLTLNGSQVNRQTRTTNALRTNQTFSSGGWNYNFMLMCPAEPMPGGTYNCVSQFLGRVPA